MLADSHQDTVEDIKEEDMEAHDPECIAGHIIDEPAIIYRLPDQIHQGQPEQDPNEGGHQRRDDIRACKAGELAQRRFGSVAMTSGDTAACVAEIVRDLERSALPPAPET